ncbi:MAG: hypothetical protein MZW92_43545 [Comamonadaceae bacterium]|nr:hypothetical protein [Comamonadaceae bacterium]
MARGAPRRLTASYRSGAAHGPDAKADLTACQSCHGQPGRPQVATRASTGASAVLAARAAKAATARDWRTAPTGPGPNATFHYTAQNIQKSCTLCHGVALNGAGGVGASCLGCDSSDERLRPRLPPSATAIPPDGVDGP